MADRRPPDQRPPDPRKQHVTVEETEFGMVIHLPDMSEVKMKETAEVRFTKKPIEPGKFECNHWRRTVLLDYEQRTAHCEKCGSNLDPFDALGAIVKDWDRIRSDFTRAREELNETLTRIRVLEKLEKNTRERLKRLGVTHKSPHPWYGENLSDLVKELIRDVRRETLATAKEPTDG